jgi:hypothetical protein
MTAFGIGWGFYECHFKKKKKNLILKENALLNKPLYK